MELVYGNGTDVIHFDRVSDDEIKLTGPFSDSERSEAKWPPITMKRAKEPLPAAPPMLPNGKSP